MKPYICAFTLIIHSSLWLFSDSQDVLEDFNEKFRMAYSQARLSKLSLIEPLMICNGDYVTIIHRGERFVERIIPKIYHDLKSISHIPLTIYLKHKFVDGPLSEDKMHDLKEYLQSVHAIRQSLRFPAEILQNQHDIIDLSIDYMRTVLKKRYIEQHRLDQFCRDAEKYIAMNVDAAARAEIDMLYEKIEPWYRKRFNHTERQSAKIIIIGPKTPRHGHVEKMFFYALLGEHREGKHIIYVENIDDEEKALEILATWYLDEDIGVSFFGNHHRLHRDLLGDAANVYIRTNYDRKKILNQRNSVYHQRVEF